MRVYMSLKETIADPSSMQEVCTSMRKVCNGPCSPYSVCVTVVEHPSVESNGALISHGDSELFSLSFYI